MAEPDLVFFKARVVDAGGGMVDLLLDRDTDHYPPIGAEVLVVRVADDAEG